MIIIYCLLQSTVSNGEIPEVPKGFTIRNIADIKSPTNKLELIHFNPRQWAALMKRVKMVKTLPETVPHRVVFQVLPWPGKDRIVMPICEESEDRQCVPIITRDSGNVLSWGCNCGPKQSGPNGKGGGSTTDNPCRFGLKNGVITCVGRCMGKCTLVGLTKWHLYITCDCKP